MNGIGVSFRDQLQPKQENYAPFSPESLDATKFSRNEEPSGSRETVAVVDCCSVGRAITFKKQLIQINLIICLQYFYIFV